MRATALVDGSERAFGLGDVTQSFFRSPRVSEPIWGGAVAALARD